MLTFLKKISRSKEPAPPVKYVTQKSLDTIDRQVHYKGNAAWGYWARLFLDSGRLAIVKGGAECSNVETLLQIINTADYLEKDKVPYSISVRYIYSGELHEFVICGECLSPQAMGISGASGVLNVFAEAVTIPD
jgi:hypothetical protein